MRFGITLCLKHSKKFSLSSIVSQHGLGGELNRILNIILPYPLFSHQSIRGNKTHHLRESTPNLRCASLSHTMGGKVSYPQVELKDKVAIVTGGNAGIGYETVKALAILGAHTIIACRSEEKGQQAVKQLKEEGQAAGKEINVELMRLDLASLESTKNFIENFKQKNLPLHMLVCNAGIALVPYEKTKDNFEKHFQVNHLGHFLICLELLPCMMATEGDKRIALVTSQAAHMSGVWEPNNLQGENGYDAFKFYANSKLYNIMTSYALQRRATDCGITVSSVNPGMVKTDVMRNSVSWNVMAIFVKTAMAIGFAKTPENGALTSINCVVNPALNSQQAIFYSDCKPDRAPATAMKEQFQEELWSVSCDLLKDWMSPEIQSKYSTRSQQSQSSDVTDKTATTSVSDDGKSPAEVAVVDDNKSADGKQPQGQQPS